MEQPAPPSIKQYIKKSYEDLQGDYDGRILDFLEENPKASLAELYDEMRALSSYENIPIYGNGKNIREWLYVEDHVQALLTISKKGKIGETYNIGSNKEITNIELTKLICKILDKLIPNNKPHSKLIKFVKDRKGHDIRYSLNSKKLENELNYKTKIKFKEGLIKTIKWYVNNKNWLLKKNKI